MKRVYVIRDDKGKLALVEGLADERPNNYLAVAPPNFGVDDIKFVKIINDKVVFNHAALVHKDKKLMAKNLWNTQTFLQRIKRAYVRR